MFGIKFELVPQFRDSCSPVLDEMILLKLMLIPPLVMCLLITRGRVPSSSRSPLQMLLQCCPLLWKQAAWPDMPYRHLAGMDLFMSSLQTLL